MQKSDLPVHVSMTRREISCFMKSLHLKHHSHLTLDGSTFEQVGQPVRGRQSHDSKIWLWYLLEAHHSADTMVQVLGLSSATVHHYKMWS